MKQAALEKMLEGLCHLDGSFYLSADSENPSALRVHADFRDGWVVTTSLDIHGRHVAADGLEWRQETYSRWGDAEVTLEGWSKGHTPALVGLPIAVREFLHTVDWVWANHRDTFVADAFAEAAEDEREVQAAYEEDQAACRLARICYELETAMQEVELAAKAARNRMTYLSEEVARLQSGGPFATTSPLHLQLERALDLLNKHV